MDATNREADTLRRTLLDSWEAAAGTADLVDRLGTLSDSEAQGAAASREQLSAWFSFAGQRPTNGLTVSDPVFDGLSEDLRERLLASLTPSTD